MIRFGSLCSGIESASVAAEPLGWSAAWFSEIEPFPCALLAHHYPAVPNIGDMRLAAGFIRDGLLEAPPVIIAGTPCQAFSVAGLRNGLADPRGALTLAYVDTINAIDEQREENDECVAVWENVPGVLSSKDNAFGCFLAALAGEDDALVPPGRKWANAGYVLGPRRAIAWRILDAQYFGLAQRRRRVFVVASARAGFDPAAVLFEREGLRRDTPPRRSEGKDVAACLDASFGRLQGCSGQDASHGRSHLVAFGGNNTSGPIDIAFVQNSRDEVRLMGGDGQIVGALAAEAGMKQQCYVARCVTGDVTHTLKVEGFGASEDGTGCGQPIVAFHHNAQAAQLPTAARDTSVTDALTCSQGAAAVGSTVRRLTPTECERLQGFPDGYTDVPYRNKPAADGPRYKALGNSKAVPVVRWVCLRIDEALRRLEPNGMIYLTPYDPTTLRCTGPSVDSGFASLDDVVALMGPPVRAGRRVHTYADVAFSDFKLRSEPDDAA